MWLCDYVILFAADRDMVTTFRKPIIWLPFEYVVMIKDEELFTHTDLRLVSSFVVAYFCEAFTLPKAIHFFSKISGVTNVPPENVMW
jgi:hypothetical protein